MLTPLEPRNWNETLAAHLLNRAGFGGTPDEVATLGANGVEQAVEFLLSRPDDGGAFPKPTWAAPRNMFAIRQRQRQLSMEEAQMMRRDEQREQRQHVLDLEHWWLQRMRDSSNPLREKMTLFWHGHFATSVQKVKDAYLMWQQNETLRQGALGTFDGLVRAMARDPAMLMWLDTEQSRRQKPNENFARELMELFTLGIGNYSENDIREAARAFTAYKMDRQTQSFRYAFGQEDSGKKSFLGRTGPFLGEDVISIILQQPACANFIVHKLWEFFVYEDPSPGLLLPLANTFRSHNYELKPLLREVFLSAEFYSPRAVRTQIKSPVQWMVGISKALEAPLPGPLPLHNALQQLGQIPFAPPNVKGWDGGKAWITTSTLLLRYNLAAFMVGNQPMDVQRGGQNRRGPMRTVPNRAPLPLQKIAPTDLRKKPQALIATLGRRLFQAPLPSRDAAPFEEWLAARDGDTSDETIRELLHLMMSTPQFQLT